MLTELSLGTFGFTSRTP